MVTTIDIIIMQDSDLSQSYLDFEFSIQCSQPAAELDAPICVCICLEIRTDTVKQIGIRISKFLTEK